MPSLGTCGWEDWSVLENQFISTEAGSMALMRNWSSTIS